MNIVSLAKITTKLDDLKELLRNSYLYRFLRLRLYNGIVVKYAIRNNLKNNHPLNKSYKYSKHKVFIPLIETSHYQIYQVLLIAKALQLRGAQVKILVCDSFLPACEIKSKRNTKVNPCLSCNMNRMYTVPEFGLETINLSELVSKKRIKEIESLAKNLMFHNPKRYEYKGIDITRIVDDSVVRYFYGGVPDDTSKELEEVRLKYLITTLIGFEAAESIQERWSPDVVFGNMEVYADWAPYHKYFVSKGVKSSTVSISQFNYKAVLINQNDLFISNIRYKNWQRARKNKGLTGKEYSDITEFISERFQGESQSFKDCGFFDTGVRVNEIINIDSNKRNIFLFSNVYWDVGISELSKFFPGVLDWVIGSINIIKNYPDCHLFIKPHPSEIFDIKSERGVIEAISKAFPELPNNVTIIYPEMRVLTYDLFKYIDVGVVYNGTLGLEMLFDNIPVIACGKTPYGGINLVSEPKEKLEYELLLVGKAPLCKPSQNEIREFAYFYFIKSLIPWKFNENAYGDQFRQFKMCGISEIMPSANYHLDHICKAIVSVDDTFIDNW